MQPVVKSIVISFVLPLELCELKIRYFVEKFTQQVQKFNNLDLNLDTNVSSIRCVIPYSIESIKEYILGSIETDDPPSKNICHFVVGFYEKPGDLNTFNTIKASLKDKFAFVAIHKTLQNGFSPYKFPTNCETVLLNIAASEAFRDISNLVNIRKPEKQPKNFACNRVVQKCLKIEIPPVPIQLENQISQEEGAMFTSSSGSGGDVSSPLEKPVSQSQDTSSANKIVLDLNADDDLISELISLASPDQNSVDDSAPLNFFPRMPNSYRLPVVKVGDYSAFPQIDLSPGTFHEVFVSHLTLRCELYVQFLQHAALIEEMSMRMLMHYKSINPADYVWQRKSKNPLRGQWCAAPFDLNPAGPKHHVFFYRAIVMQKVDDHSYQVFFADYGNQQMVNENNLLILPVSFRSLSPLALRCKYVPENSDEKVEYKSLKQHFDEQQLGYIKILRANNSSYEVSCWNKIEV